MSQNGLHVELMRQHILASGKQGIRRQLCGGGDTDGHFRLRTVIEQRQSENECVSANR